VRRRGKLAHGERVHASRSRSHLPGFAGAASLLAAHRLLEPIRAAQTFELPRPGLGARRPSS
jgi:hypothetical protein